MAVNYELRSVENGSSSPQADGTLLLQVIISVGIVGDTLFAPQVNYSTKVVIQPTDTAEAMQAKMEVAATEFLTTNYPNVP